MRDETANNEREQQVAHLSLTTVIRQVQVFVSQSRAVVNGQSPPAIPIIYKGVRTTAWCESECTERPFTAFTAEDDERGGEEKREEEKKKRRAL
jgi:hypothetical protein